MDTEETMSLEFKKRVIHFRGMLVDVVRNLSAEDRSSLAFIYLLETDGECKVYPLLKHLTGENLVRNCPEDLEILKKHLSNIGQSNLTELVDQYIATTQIKLEAPLSQDPSKCQSGMEEKQSNDDSAHGLIGLSPPAPLGGKIIVKIEEARPQGTKRPRTLTLEEKDLEEATTEFMMCDTTSDSSGEDNLCEEEITQEDRGFMKQAKEYSSKSPDTETKVGAVIVKESKIVGKGWNRFPTGCEERFNWVVDRNKQSLEDGKHLYVVYAIRAAILHAYQNGADLNGAMLYTTLYPSNICAQCIRDAGIKEVVYISDKFHKTKFMKASKKIMEGIKCRQYSTKD